MSSDAKEHIRDKLRCRPNGALASARPRESAAIFPTPCTIRWCTGQPSFCLPFGFYFSLGCFHWVFASLLFGFLDKAGVLFGSSVVVPPVFPFFSPCLPCPFVFCLVCFASFFFLFLLHSLRVHSCWGFVCTFASFVDFPFFFWRVSCEKGFPLFQSLHWVPRCQNVFLSPLVGLDIFLVELARTEVSSEETFPSIYQGSTYWKPGDAWPIPSSKKKSCLCGCPQGNRLGTISSSNLQGWSFLRLLSFGKVWKENNAEWLMVKTRLIRRSPQCLFVTSETDVTDLARISRLKQADEIRPDRHAFLPS